MKTEGCENSNSYVSEIEIRSLVINRLFFLSEELDDKMMTESMLSN